MEREKIHATISSLNKEALAPRQTTYSPETSDHNPITPDIPDDVNSPHQTSPNSAQHSDNGPARKSMAHTSIPVKIERGEPSRQTIQTQSLLPTSASEIFKKSEQVRLRNKKAKSSALLAAFIDPQPNAERVSPISLSQGPVSESSSRQHPKKRPAPESRQVEDWNSEGDTSSEGDVF